MLGGDIRPPVQSRNKPRNQSNDILVSSQISRLHFRERPRPILLSLGRIRVAKELLLYTRASISKDKTRQWLLPYHTFENPVQGRRKIPLKITSDPDVLIGDKGRPFNSGKQFVYYIMKEPSASALAPSASFDQVGN